MVATISAVKNKDYFPQQAKLNTKGQAKEYYSDHGEPNGTWTGTGSRYFGLNGKTIEYSDYNNLMEGFSPNGHPLVQNAGDDARRCAWDCTFSVPKSISVLWACSTPTLQKKIEEAMRQAVQEAIHTMESKAAITRRGKGSKQYEEVSGLIVATYEHCTNRAQEPQLHTHALVLNVAPREDGTFGSIDSYKIYRWIKPLGAIFRSEMAFQMKKLGFEIEPDSDSFRIKGIPKEICDDYSSRTKDIQKELNNAGLKSSASKEGQHFKLTTRQRKSDVNRNTLFKHWREEINQKGLTQAIIQDLVEAEKTSQPNFLDHALILAELTERKSTFTEQDLFYLVAVKASHCGINAEQAQLFIQLIIENESVITLSRNEAYSPLFTTREVLLNEQLMIEDAKLLANNHSKTLESSLIKNAIKEAEAQLGFDFDAEQKAAIDYTLESGDFCITQGSAGAGKTTLMLAAKIAYENQGLQIAGASIAKKAADNLFEETGISSRTIASYINLIEKGQHPLRNIDVLVIDEAGLVSSTDLQALLYEARTSNCKLILTGEDRQLDAINKGGALRYLSRPEILGTQRIGTIRRQRQGWARQVVADLRDGRSESALNILREKSCLHWAENKETAKQALIKDWHHYQKAHPDKQSLVLAQQWKDVKVLSEAIRNIYIKEGRVGTENVPLQCSVADKLFNYEFSVGDRVKFCRNDYRALQVSNGTLGTIKKIESLKNDTRLTIEIDDKRTVSFLSSEYSDDIGVNLCHAYALTIFSSQGTTIDGNTFTLYSGSMNRANTYVALSRHKDESHLYINSAEINERCRAKDISVELTQEMREAQLAELTKRDNYHSLAIEHLAQREMQREKELQQLHVAELEV